MLTSDAAIAIYSSIITPTLKYNCIVQLKLTLTQQNRLIGIEKFAARTLNTKVNSIKDDFYKHAVKLVRKCVEGNTCSNSKNYFELKHHSKSTRNKGLFLKVPKVKLEFAKSGFFAMGVKLYNELPKEIRETNLGFRQKLKTFNF